MVIIAPKVTKTMVQAAFAPDVGLLKLSFSVENAQ